MKYLSKYLLIYLVSTQISVNRIRPDQNFCRHPNTDDAAVNVLKDIGCYMSTKYIQTEEYDGILASCLRWFCSSP